MCKRHGGMKQQVIWGNSGNLWVAVPALVWGAGGDDTLGVRS